MPRMGKPISQEQNRLANIKMAEPRRRANGDLESNEKERLLNRLTGYKPETTKFVDAKTHNKMGKDEFLKLLTHQLANQDPQKPMDQKNMATQLAQFSSLEQLTNLNTKFEKVVGDKTVQDKFYGASFLGKEVITNGSSLRLKEDGGLADVMFKLPQDSQKVLVRVLDQKNGMVGEMWRENIGRGNQSITWDGQSLDGTPAAKGDYKVQVFAWDQNSDPIKVETKTRGIVESVTFENGEAVLMASGNRVFLRDVESFHSVNPSDSKQKNDAPAKNPQNKLPVAPKEASKVNLNSNKVNAMNAYRNNEVGTGITSVYDVE